MTIRHPIIASTVEDLRRSVGQWRADGQSVGLVPTMGALHAGHLSLVEAARRRVQKVVVSIFVNPAQFAPNEDFDAYPRTFEDDLRKLRPYDVEAVFAPNATHMYPEGFATRIEVGGPSQGLESAFRPHFFSGVATVVTKLLLAVQPDIAFFGEKDYQQYLVVRRMARDLMIPCEIAGVPTVREADGLALSSRNVYLTKGQRAIAPRLNGELRAVANAVRAGCNARKALEAARHAIDEAGFRLDYLELRHAETLEPLHDSAADSSGEFSRSSPPKRLLVAAWLGSTRLIDNIAV